MASEFQDSGFDPSDLLIQIPSKIGLQIEEEMLNGSEWQDYCEGIELFADGHRKQISIYGIRAYWKINLPTD